MSFADIFALYPLKVMELCVEAASDTGRSYCYLPDAPPWQDQCVLCDRLAFDDGAPGGWHNMKRVCESGDCRRLWAWIEAPGKEGGVKRRRILKERFGGAIWTVPHGMRREAILATMLEYESLEKLRARKPRLCMAA